MSPTNLAFLSTSVCIHKYACEFVTVSTDHHGYRKAAQVWRKELEHMLITNCKEAYGYPYLSQLFSDGREGLVRDIINVMPGIET